MAKQLNVNLQFTADTQQAQKQLQDLQQSLTKIVQSAGMNSPFGLTKEIGSAVEQTNKLQIALQKATTDTGKLDLGQFRKELQTANLDASKIAQNLTALGPEGQIAFSKLAQSVTMAEIPLKRTNTLLTQFATTLKNTARWQISSSILHGFMGSIQSAYRYAQDLNESLTNIQIVTGQSSEQMADFAKQANNAAKALSTTTTAYTDAALIFYQQGLTGEDVTSRADTVIKLANVTGQSAEEVSSYMTAIWNNFDNGSESLEHYADVITALGASTASSSAEIAQGLEKFAAIGETVGLSYDYATSALATVVANTRQSADTVGTAFKTIFARIQGLSLGETLEDGVDLNKYSKALQSVGVSVLDTTGNMRELDDILDDLADKWDILSSAQQTALAQTVAGTRQYNQLVALMNNWSDMQTNLSTAKDAEGTLQEQQDTYAKSWEAANKRVKASFQAVYTDLVDSDFFIKLADTITTIVDGIHNLIQSLGGLKGLLPIISTLMLSAFGKDISKAISNAAYNFQLFTKKGKEQIIEMRATFSQELQNMTKDNTLDLSWIYQQQGALQQQLIDKTVQLQHANIELSDSEQLQIQKLMDENTLYAEQYRLAMEQLEIIKEETAVLEQKAVAQSTGMDLGLSDDTSLSQYLNNLNNVSEKWEEVYRIKEAFNETSGNFGDNAALEALKNFRQALEDISPVMQDDTGYIAEMYNALDKLQNAKGPKEIDEAFIELEGTLEAIGTGAFDNLINNIDDTTKEGKALIKTLETLQNKWGQHGKAVYQTSKAYQNINNNFKTTEKTIQNFSGKIPSLSDKFIQSATSASRLVMGINSLRSAFEAFKDGDLFSGFTSLLFAIPAIKPVLEGFKDIPVVVDGIKAASQQTRLLSESIMAETTAQKAATIATQASEVANKKEAISQKARIAADALLAKEKNVVVETEIKGLAKVITAEELEKLKNGELTISEIAKNHEKELGLEIDARHFTNSPKRIAALEAEANANWADAAAIEAKNAAESASATSSTAAAAAEEAEATAAGSAAAATAGLTAAAGVATIAITALVLIIGAIIKAQKEKLKQQIEIAKAQIEEANATQEQIDANGELYDSYEKLYQQYKNNEDVKSQLDETTQKLYESYGIEISYLDELNDRYDKYIDKLRQAREEELEEAKESAKQEQSAAGNQMVAKARDGRGYVRNGIYNLTFGNGLLNEKSDQLVEQYAQQKGLDLGSYITFEENDYASYAQYYDQIDEILKSIESDTNLKPSDYQSSEYYKRMKEWRDRMKESVEAYKAATEDIQKYSAQLAVIQTDFYNVDSLEDYEKKIAEVSAKLEEQGVENPEQVARSYAIANSEIAKSYDNQLKLISEFGDKWQDLTNEQIRNLVETYSNTDLNLVYNLGVNPGSIEEFEHYLNYVQSLAEREDITLKVNLVTSAMGEINENGQISEETLEKLKEEYSDKDEEFWENLAGSTRAEQINIINDLLEEQTQLILENAKARKQEAEESKTAAQNRIIELQKEHDILVNELQGSQLGLLNDVDEDEIIADIQKIEEEISNLQNQIDDGVFDIEINIVDTALEIFENRVNGIIDSAQEIKNAVELIGEGFIVAAEDAEELFAVYPALQNAAEVLANGDIQLNQEVVQAILNGNKEVIESNSKVEEAKLETQIEVLQAEINYNQQRMKILDQYLKSEINQKEVEEELNKATADYEAQLIDAVGETQVEAARQSAQANKETSDVVLANFDKIGAQAKVLGKAIIQALAGQDVTYNPHSAGATAGNLSSYEKYADKAIGSVQGNSDFTAQVEAEMARLKAETPELESQLAYTQLLLSKLRSGTSSAIEAIDGAGSKKVESGGSAKDPKQEEHEEYVEDLADRYHDLNEAIQEVEHSMSMLSKAQDHLSGASLIKSLQKQNELIAKQRENYAALNEELAKEAGELQGKLGKYGASFGDDGSILNYTDTFNAIKAEYNNAVDAYNSVIDWFNSLSAEQQDSVGEAAVKTAKEALDNAKDTYDKAKDYLERYDEVIDDIQSNEETMLDQLYEIIENNLKAFEIEVQLNLDISEATRTVNDFIKTVTNDFKKVYKSIQDWSDIFDLDVSSAQSYINGPDSTIYTDLSALQKVKDIIDNPDYDYLSENSLFASRDDAINKYKELNDQLRVDGEALYSLYESTWNEYLSAMDESIQQWKEVEQEFEDINDDLDHYAKLNELLYGGEDTQQGRNNLNDIYQAQIDNSLAKQRFLSAQIEAWQKEREELIAAGANEGDEDIKKIDETLKELNKDVQSEIETYAENIIKKMQNANAIAKDNMDQNIWGKSFSDVQEQWQDAKKKADGYYDSVERVYELQSLQSKWQDAINSTSSVKVQQQLTALMNKQLEGLEEKTALSETDVELAEKELEVYKAQVELENAQNNKNAMKLVRNQQGNWAYQYVVDEDDVAAKQQDVLDKTNEWRTASINAAEEVQDKIYEAYEEFTSRLLQIENDVTLSEQERAERVEYLNDLYWGENGIITKAVEDSNFYQQMANEATVIELYGLYQQDEDNYKLMTDKEKDLVDELNKHSIDSYSELRDLVATNDDSIYNQLIDKAEDVNDDSSEQFDLLSQEIDRLMVEGDDAVLPKVIAAEDEMQGAFDQYKEDIDSSEEAIGQSWSNITDGITAARDRTGEVSAKVGDLIAQTDALDGFRSKVTEIADAWDDVKDKIINAVSELRTYLELLKQPVELPTANTPNITPSADTSGTPSTTGVPSATTITENPGDDNSGGGQVDKSYSWEVKARVTGIVFGSGSGLTKSGAKSAAEKFAQNWISTRPQAAADPGDWSGKKYVITIGEKNAFQYNSSSQSNNSIGGSGRDTDVRLFDTGGYTGNWTGTEGKLALLHSKELVLNADDTENMLSAVSAVRDIANIGNSFASSIANGLTGMVAGILGVRSGEVSTAASTNNSNNTFNITAEFPNANSVAEIQEAILTLPTLASQYLAQRSM